MFTTVAVGTFSNAARCSAPTAEGRIRTPPSNAAGNPARAGGLKTLALLGMNRCARHWCNATTCARIVRPLDCISTHEPTFTFRFFAVSVATESTGSVVLGDHQEPSITRIVSG